MIKSIFIGIISFLVVQSSEIPIEEKIPDDEVFCRITCAIMAWNQDGHLVYATATAGGIFTSCTKAREKACAKAFAQVNNEN